MAADIHLPYQFISGLPRRAQKEIWEDFQAFIRQFPSSPTIFDAIIDSELTASVASEHRYKNATELMASESWTGTLNVGVRQGPTAIVEPASVAITGDVSFFGIGSGIGHDVPFWNLGGAGVSGGTNVFLKGLAISHLTSGQFQNGGSCTAMDCYFDSDITGLSAGGISGQYQEAWNSYFAGAQTVAGSIGVGLQANYYNCRLNGGITANSQMSAKVLGGYCAGVTWNSTSGSISIIADLSGGSVTLNGTGSAWIENTASAGGNVTVTACSGDCVIIGAFGNSVTYTAVPGSGQKFQFVGSCAALTTAGGVHAVCTVGTAFVSGRLQVGGVANQIVVQFNKFTVPAVKFVAATHSQVHASLKDQGAGSQAYTFDSSSNNNLLILSGINQAGFTTASTDAGSNNRVITETTDTLAMLVGAAAGGDLTGTYPNPTIGTNKVSNAKLAQMATMTLKGNDTGSTANAKDLTLTEIKTMLDYIESGDAAGGDLAGTYPNPTVQDDSHAHTSSTLPATIVYDGDAAGGDLGGTYPDPDVVALQGTPVDPTAPTTFDVLTFDGVNWAPAASAGGPPSGTAGGDLSGTYPNPTVDALQGTPVSASAPSANDVLQFDGADWAPAPLPAGVPSGSMMLWPAAAAPTDWLLCDGTSYLRADYPDLFSALGGASSPWGLPDGTHFNVPDLRERFPLGKGATHALADTGGATTHSHGVGTIADGGHTHGVGTIAAGSHEHNLSGGSSTGAVSSHNHDLGSHTHTGPSHSHGLSAGYAKISMASGVGIIMARSSVTAYNDTHIHTATGQSITAETVSRSSAADLGGSTDAAGTGNTGAASGNTGSTQPTLSGHTDATTPSMSGTSASGTASLSGSTATASGPIDPFVTVNYIIKT